MTGSPPCREKGDFDIHIGSLVPHDSRREYSGKIFSVMIFGSAWKEKQLKAFGGGSIVVLQKELIFDLVQPAMLKDLSAETEGA